MKKRLYLAIALLGLQSHSFAQAGWQQLTLPSYEAMARAFATPPHQYAQTLTWGLEGPLSRESIQRDLDAMYKQGIPCVSIEGGYGMKEPYLSPGYFENVQIIVEELKKRGMHVWIIDEGKYPSGFAGGLISQKSPELRMQGVVVAKRIRTEDNQPLTLPLPPQTLSAVAVKEGSNENKLLDISSGTLTWPATAGVWNITVVDHRYKTSVTRSANNPVHGKDTTNSLIDYLDPVATRKFMEYTHEQYKKYIGNEFGKTVLGFRGDEPEYGFIPWTPQMLTIFQQKKQYDIQPYLASFYLPQPTAEQQRAFADYSDVWSDLFRDNFFKVQADWCRENGLEYMVHLNHEDMLMKLVRSEGDFFKDMRYVQVPGVDAIWHQIWYDNVTDFPKLASSAAHMYGRPRAFSESFAAYTPAPTVDDARWVVNEQLVRGINLFEYMFWPSSANGRAQRSSYLTDTAFASLSTYSNRASWLLANGIPQAKVGLYCPTSTLWLGNKWADSTLRVIGKNLLENQVDFDYVDQQGLATGFSLQNGAFTNLSGQQYTAILIPACTVMHQAVLARLEAFAKGGGKVFFMAETPALVAADNILEAKAAPAISWAKQASWQQMEAGFYKQLPRDVMLTQPAPSIKYLHRKWKDADLYFFFNEHSQAQQNTVTLNGAGRVFYWDAATGQASAAPQAKSQDRKTTLPLTLNGYATRFVIIKH